MGHLEDNNISYFDHLKRAWSLAFILIIHGLLPEIWKTKATEVLLHEKEKLHSGDS